MTGYQLLLVSAVGERDGMAVELATEAGDQVAEVFQDDASGNRSVRFFSDQPVPINVVEWFLAEAATRL